MKKDYTHIAVVLDRSGSMYSIEDDTIGGFNTFLKEQKEVPGTATFTLTQFDTVYDIVHDFRPIGEVPELNSQTYVPRGATALYDAIGRTITEVGKVLHSKREQDKPEKVIFVIITDGEENSSREFSYEQISSMIEHQKNVYNWEFVFLGANQDAMKVGDKLGVGAMNAMTYGANAGAVHHVYTVLSKKAATFRAGVTTDMAYSTEEREEQEKVN